jgi:hypothetical protein
MKKTKEIDLMMKPMGRSILEVTPETTAAAERIRRFISEQQALNQISLRAATQVLEQSQLLKNVGYDDPVNRHLLEVDAFTKSATEKFRRVISEQQQLMNEAAINAAKLMSSSIRPLKISAIDFEELNKAMMLGIGNAAEHGWTIVGWIDIPVTRAFAKWTGPRIASFFETSYLDEPERRLRKLSKTLLSDSSFTPWKDLLRESFRAFNLGLYRVCVPSLISILEGYAISRLVESAKNQKKLLVKRDTKPDRRLKELHFHNDKRIKGLIWTSLIGFFDKLYIHSDFSMDRPSFLNRNWILHGRSECNWTKSDALRLFNALDTLRWACEDLTPNS